MEKLSLKMVFSDENGNKVDAMSSDSVSPEMVMSAMSFMKKGSVITLEVISAVLPDGK